jgi:dihydrofolate reductase
MRKVILSVAVSLDGFIEGPGGEYDWCFTDQDYGMADFLKKIDTIFMGRKSYELVISMGDEAARGFPKMNEYVFSNTLNNVKEGMTLIKGKLKDEVEKLRSEPGKDIWLFGGAGLTTSFMNEGLVDEISVAVHPILLGKGKPLFTDIDQRIILKLKDSKTYDSGLVMLTYQVEK